MYYNTRASCRPTNSFSPIPYNSGSTDLRNGLLGLHKTLLDSERASYERDIARISSSGELLRLVLYDPWFAWLHELSEFVVLIDETLDASKRRWTPRTAGHRRGAIDCAGGGVAGAERRRDGICQAIFRSVAARSGRGAGPRPDAQSFLVETCTSVTHSCARSSALAAEVFGQDDGLG